MGVLAELKSFLNQYYEKASRHPKVWIGLYVLISIILLYWYPPVQLSLYDGINNVTAEATLINQFRFTLAQILGGGAVAIGIYFAWTNFIVAQETLKVAQENQITERFTRAIDQLGNEKMEIRLGGIYALERIANESERDYGPIMEILTAYIRNNSSFTDIETAIKSSMGIRVSSDIQTILTVIGRREIPSNVVKLNYLDLQNTYLQKAVLAGADLTETKLDGASFRRADLKGANLEGAINLTIDQLSKVKTLYDVKLDKELLIPLKEKYPALFEEPNT